MGGRQKDPSISWAEFVRYKTLIPLVESMHSDIRELSRKNQNAPLSNSRISMINRLLTDAQDLLKNEPTAAYLPILDQATVPQNADALLILGQFKAALNQFLSKYTYYDEDEEGTFWRISDGSHRKETRVEET
jgi:hypothetical protein